LTGREVYQEKSIMRPADDLAPHQLLGKRVAFKPDAAHAGCWHAQVGLKTGVVVKLGQSLAQKAELVAAEGELPPELLCPEYDVPRVWVRADPCPAFPRGCETAVEKECLLLIEG
jgi:hypothetical protein